MQFRQLLMLLPLALVAPIGCQPHPPVSVAQSAAQPVTQPVTQPTVKTVAATPLPSRDDISQRLSIPPQSPFHSPKPFPYRGPAAKLAGEAWVQGTLKAEWTGTADRPRSVAHWELVPDRPEQLPQFKTHAYQTISITRTDALAAMTFGPEMGRQFAAQELPSAQIKGKFLIRNFEVGVTCDSAWARATLQQVDIPPKVAAERGVDRKTSGC
jgi:hypothetical protein